MNKSPAQAHNTSVATPASPAAPAKELWQATCVRFTVICFILLIVSAIAATSQHYVDTVHFLLLLPFSFCLTLTARVRRSATLSVGAKCSLHPLLFLGGFYLCCYLPYQIKTKPSGQQVMIILLLVALIYAISMGIYAAVHAKTRQKAIDNTPYESQFGSK